MIRLQKRQSNSRIGFTLVEMIVIMIVLAVIAAMIVPSFTGYIKRAKEEQEHAKVLLAMDAMATTLNNLTIKKLPAFNYANQNTDVDWSAESAQYSDYGEAVLEMMGLSRDSEPYILIIGAGDYYLYENDPSMRNQVFFAAYVPEKGADALFYIDGNWYKTYPWDTYADNPQHKVMVGNTEKLPGDTEQMRHTNRAYIDGERVFIQLYVISNNTPYDTASSNFWNAADGLKGHSQTV